ncbi:MULTISPECIES: recombinase RecT [Gammaproteobacteria]|uniref:Recombinase RecT n=2 Tax=Gammaproteobacteria TaxID=1236 RepID=A0AAX3NYH8_9GAMM|nr:MULTISPECIES: recombinase RecT [Gammaproteobacteria]MDV0844457.1 recombinase RecT [Klebsiella quasipneumoniae subsp. quasipneumoniae]WED79189.1 recombinase RecT [Aeromonas allosaccharophila]
MSETNSLVVRMASRFGVDGDKFYATLKATAFKQRDGSEPTHEQMLALMVVAEQYNLNPFTREIYAFPDKQNKGIVPVVGVDGWSRIINDHPQYDGVEFVYTDKMVKMPGANVECPEWIECVIYRKDRSRPTRIKEFLDEVYRPPFQGDGEYGAYTVNGPWQTHTKRQLRHKVLIQCARVALGFSGIYDQDEAERIREMEQATAINPAVANLPSPETVSQIVPEPVQEVVLIEHKEMDPMLTKLVGRAIKGNAWSAAHEYVEERYKGTQLAYAVHYLREKQMDHMPPADADYQDMQGPVIEHDQAGAAPVVQESNSQPSSKVEEPPVMEEEVWYE